MTFHSDGLHCNSMQQHTQSPIFIYIYLYFGPQFFFGPLTTKLDCKKNNNNKKITPPKKFSSSSTLPKKIPHKGHKESLNRCG